jgi:phage/plasmid-like protein (TIGR03299 family)
MAHLVETMAYAGETPWHGLGKPVPSDLSPWQMLDAAGLDWKVEKIPSFVDISGKKVYTGKDALVRSTDGKILDVVSQDWNPMQNEEAFEFFNDFVHSGDMEMHTAGSLRNGQIVWALAKVKESCKLLKSNHIES